MKKIKQWCAKGHCPICNVGTGSRHRVSCPNKYLTSTQVKDSQGVWNATTATIENDVEPMLQPRKTLRYWFKRLVYFIKHGRDYYGKSGFTQLMYKGIPIVQRDDVPTGELWLVDFDPDNPLRLTPKRVIKLKDLENGNVHNKTSRD